MLILKKGVKYTLVFNVGGKVLTYTGTIISYEENFIVFTDKFGEEFTYNVNSLISSKVKEGDDNGW